MKNIGFKHQRENKQNSDKNKNHEFWRPRQTLSQKLSFDLYLGEDIFCGEMS